MYSIMRLRIPKSKDDIECNTCGEFYNPNYNFENQWHKGCEQRQDKIFAMNELVKRGLITIEEYKKMCYDAGIIYKWS